MFESYFLYFNLNLPDDRANFDIGENLTLGIFASLVI